MSGKYETGAVLSFDDFTTKCRMLDEACRQWCNLIDEAPGRRDGILFTEFYNEICQQKYQEYLDDPSYRDDCNYYASLSDEERYNMALRESINASLKSDSHKQADKPSILGQLQHAKEAAPKSDLPKSKKPPGRDL